MIYRFGGVALDTPFRFDQLERTDDRPARGRLSLQPSGETAPEEAVVHRTNGRYRLSSGKAGGDWVFRSRFPGTLVFSPARHAITCHDVVPGDDGWRDVLLRRVLPRVATTLGAIAIHAAAVSVDNRCLLLLGHSGAGKSTLTTFCARAGWHVLSDDITLLWTDDAGILAEPVQDGTVVWNDVRDALDLDRRHCTGMAGYDGKWCYRPPTSTPRKGRHLSAILVLDRASGAATPTVTALSREEAIALTWAQNIPFVREVRPSATTATSFGRVSSLVRRVPSFRLTYPDGYAALPAVAALMRDAVLEGVER